jgi:hypothetical protein
MSIPTTGEFERGHFASQPQKKSLGTKMPKIRLHSAETNFFQFRENFFSLLITLKLAIQGTVQNFGTVLLG